MDHKSTKILYTVLIFLNTFTLKILFNQIWPSLVDLSYIYNVHMRTINYITLPIAIGGFIGSFNGFLYKWINKQLYLSIMVLLSALARLFIPFYPNIVCLFIAIFISAIGGASWNSAINVWIVEMWPKNHASILQAASFMSGLGSMIGPALVSPFLYGVQNGTEISAEKRRNSLAFPFCLAASIQAIIPTILLVLYFTKLRYRRPEPASKPTIDEKGSTKTRFQHPGPGRISWRRTKLILMALTASTYAAPALAYVYYSSTVFQYNSGTKLSAAEAAHVATVLSASYTVGQFCSTFIALKIEPDIILIYHYTILVVAQILFYLTRNSIPMIYVTTVLRGYGFAAMGPAILSYIAKHMKLTDKVCTMLFVSHSATSIFIPILIGPYLQTNPDILFLFISVCLTFSIVCFTIVESLILLSKTNLSSNLLPVVGNGQEMIGLKE